MKKVAPTEKVKEILQQVLRSHLKIESQEELANHTLKILRKENENYSLSPTRAKRIALQIPEIEVKAKTKKTIRLQKIESCPICESSIQPITIKNLLDKEITIGHSCTSCGYESDLEAFMPMKYSFLWTPTEKV